MFSLPTVSTSRPWLSLWFTKAPAHHHLSLSVAVIHSLGIFHHSPKKLVPISKSLSPPNFCHHSWQLQHPGGGYRQLPGLLVSWPLQETPPCPRSSKLHLQGHTLGPLSPPKAACLQYGEWHCKLPMPFSLLLLAYLYSDYNNSLTVSILQPSHLHFPSCLP